MIKTRITELLGIETPIVGGTMMDISRAPFVAALSNAGVLGVLASAIYHGEDDYRDDLRRLKDLTGKPFAVNLNLFPAMRRLDNARLLEIGVEEGVRIFETSGIRAPDDLAPLFKQAGVTWIHKCVGVRYAKKVAAMGADAVTVVGFENGGATGTLNIGSFVLAPAAAAALDVPVIGGGGVADGRGLAAMLCLGAEGVIVGTRFLLALECPVHPDLKAQMCRATELDTDVIMKSVGFAHRVWMNEPAKKAKEVEDRGGGLSELMPYVSGEAARRMYETGDVAAGTVSCSQAVGLMRKVMPLAEIVRSMVEEAEAVLRRLARASG